jgi:hypothetical protein
MDYLRRGQYVEDVSSNDRMNEEKLSEKGFARSGCGLS